MRRVMPSLFLLLVTSSPALAVFCARDVVPAATLLVPYVEVDMTGNSNNPVPDRNGITTILRVTNTAAEAALVELVIWTAVGEPVVTLHAALSGYDMWTVDFADLLSGTWSRFDTSLSTAARPNVELGELKRTPFESGPDGRSVQWVRAPYTQPWPRGLASPGKTSELPGEQCLIPYGDAVGYQYAPLFVQKLQEPLYAREHLGCGQKVVTRHSNDWMAWLTANPLFFYATVHVVRSCGHLWPTDAGYAEQVALDRDVLLGEVEVLHPSGGTLELLPAVHLETALSAAQVATVGPFEAQGGHEDRREPLATAFAFPYENLASVTGSSLMLWKPFYELDDKGLTWDEDVRDCGAYMYYAWDQDEHVIARGCNCPFSGCECGDSDPNEFPFVTQLVPLTNANLDLPSASGWMLLVLPPSYVGFTQDPTPSTLEPQRPLSGVCGGADGADEGREDRGRMDGGGHHGQCPVPDGRRCAMISRLLPLLLLAPVVAWASRAPRTWRRPRPCSCPTSRLRCAAMCRIPREPRRSSGWPTRRPRLP